MRSAKSARSPAGPARRASSNSVNGGSVFALTRHGTGPNIHRLGYPSASRGEALKERFRDEADSDDQPLQGRPARVQLPPLRAVQARSELLGQAPVRRPGAKTKSDALTECTASRARSSARSTPSATAGLPDRGRSGHHADRLQGGVEEALRGGLEADRRQPGARRRGRARTRAGPRSRRCSRARTPRSTCTPASRYGAAEVIESFGTRSRRSSTASRMFTGEWGGTMCLTEPQAGTDVGSAKTTRLAQRRRQLHDPRHEDLHLGRRPRPGREHRPPRARPRATARRRAPRGSRSSSCPKMRINADGTLGGRNDVSVGAHRAQDGHQRRRRHACSTSATTAVPRRGRSAAREAQPGHAADVQADEQRAHLRRRPGPRASRRRRT